MEVRVHEKMAAKTTIKKKSTASTKAAAKTKTAVKATVNATVKTKAKAAQKTAGVKAKAKTAAKSTKMASAKSPAKTPAKAALKRAPANAAMKSKAAVKKSADKAPAKTISAAKAAPRKPAAKAKKSPPAKVVEVAKAPVKNPQQRHGFKIKEFIVYPSHGVGQIVDIETQEVAGLSLELYVISFENEKMTLRVPTIKWQSVGMRKLSETAVAQKALTTLKGKARVKRTMWSRRAQEYEAKINSGNLGSVAEVVRDLYRSETQPEQSYSERQLYEAALERMAREIAAVEKIDDQSAVQMITRILLKSVEKLRKSELEADAEEAQNEAA